MLTDRYCTPIRAINGSRVEEGHLGANGFHDAGRILIEGGKLCFGWCLAEADLDTLPGLAETVSTRMRMSRPVASGAGGSISRRALG